jgi:hypothetical protein
MKRTVKYVGMDVHQATTVATVRAQNGQVIARTVIPTEATALKEFFGGMRGPIQVAFEEGTQAQWLRELLVPLVQRVIVCDRRGARRQGNHGDHQDADWLASRLRLGELRAVYHGNAERQVLKELARTYRNLVEDSTRVMQRLKALFRARAIATAGERIYHPKNQAQWIAKLPDRGARVRAEILYEQLAVLQKLRPRAKAAMVSEARRDPAWALLHTIPFFGPIRVSMLLAVLQTPWRFRTKRQLWGYAGLAVVTHTTAEYMLVGGRPTRRRRPPMTRGLNRNHNRVIKDVFKGAAGAAIARPGPLRDFYDRMIARGMEPALAQVTLARKLAAVTLRLWKKGERFDPTKLTVQAQ